MKRLLIFGLCMIPFCGWSQDVNFKISAKMGASVPNGAKVYFNYYTTQGMHIDSTTVANGAFQFKGTSSEPTKAQLLLDSKGVGISKLGANSDMLVFFLDNGEIIMNSRDSLKNAIISGSKLNEDYKKYTTLTAEQNKKLLSIVTEFNSATNEQKSNPEFKSKIESQYASMLASVRETEFLFIKNFPNSFLSLVILKEIATQSTDLNPVEKAFVGLSKELKQTKMGIGLNEILSKANSTSIGAVAPVFTQNDPEGKPVKLSDFKGKFVLVDFWASWCGPCRAENPNVVKAYHMYKDKQFTILGVSLDKADNKDKWLQAIKDDKLEWAQVSDLKFWNNEAAILYGVRGIPQNYLIDPNGKIVAKNLRGEELIEKLKVLLK